MSLDMEKLRADYSALETEFGKDGAAVVAGIMPKFVSAALEHEDKYTVQIAKFFAAREAAYKLYSEEQGKKVCEDWASILLNSKTHIKISDEATSLFVQGRRETEGILGANSFWTKGNRLIERAFATGTGAVTIHAMGIKLTGSGDDLTADISPDADIQFNYLSAEYIIPLTVDNDRIMSSSSVSSAPRCSARVLTCSALYSAFFFIGLPP